MDIQAELTAEKPSELDEYGGKRADIFGGGEALESTPAALRLIEFVFDLVEWSFERWTEYW